MRYQAKIPYKNLATVTKIKPQLIINKKTEVTKKECSTSVRIQQATKTPAPITTPKRKILSTAS